MVKPKVIIGLAHKGKIKSEIAEFLFQAESPEGKERYLLTAEGVLYQAYNKLIKFGLKKEEVEWFFLINENQALEPWTLRYLVEEAEEEDLKVVVPITFDYQFKFPIPILHDIKERVRFSQIISGDIYQMEEVPNKCILIHRSVVESLEEPWFEENEAKNCVTDSIFSQKCREKDFRLYINESVVAGNSRLVDLSDYYDILQLLITEEKKTVTEELHDMIWARGKINE